MIKFSISMKKSPRKIPRIPLDALRRLGSHSVIGKKGDKGYDRQKAEEEAKKTIKEESS